MCGRYASSRGADDLVDAFEVEEPPEEELAPSYNVAPTDPVPVVLVRDGTAAAGGALGAGAVVGEGRQGRGAADQRAQRDRRGQAGVPGGVRAAALPGAPPTATTSGSRRAPQAALLPDDPRRLAAADGRALRGLGRAGRHPAVDLHRADHVGADELGEIHDRTPLLVPRADWGRWLDPEVPDPGRDLLTPGVPGVLDAWPVSSAVGNVRNDGPELVEPLPHPPEQPTLL
jgi:hypothetical protein